VENRRFLVAIFATLALGALAPVSAQAQPYPSKVVRIVVPFSPGSATDILARMVGEKLNAQWGQPFIVENRPGAGGTIGTGLAAKSKPDGYTLVVVSAGHVVNPAIYDNLPYDTLRDFAGIIPLASLPSVLTVPRSLGVKSVQELVALAKAKPGQLNYASGGVGSASHVNAEKFRTATGIDAVHVPLKGAPEMMTEMLGGRLQFGFLPLIAATPMLKDGKLLALAVSGGKRAPGFPDVPTIGEAGVPGAEFNFWIGMLAPAKTPRDIVTRLNVEIAKIVQLAEIAARFASLGAEPFVLSPEVFDAFIKEEFATLGPIMKAAGAKAK